MRCVGWVVNYLKSPAFFCFVLRILAGKGSSEGGAAAAGGAKKVGKNYARACVLSCRRWLKFSRCVIVLPVGGWVCALVGVCAL